LRMLIVRRLYNWSFEQTERNVSDSLILRQFCRLYLQAVPDDTTLIRWASLIGPKTLERLKERAVALAFERRVTRGRKLRTDATVVETDICHPTDSGLLNDGLRVLGRLMGKAKEILGQSGEQFRNRARSAKRLVRSIASGARRRGEEAKEASKEAYERLIGVARAGFKQATKVLQMLLGAARLGEGLAEKIELFEGLLERVVDQTERRVLKGESVKAGEKLVSLFEEHTAIISRGKAGKKMTEFGRKVWLEEVEGGIVSGLPHPPRQPLRGEGIATEPGEPPKAVRAPAVAGGGGPRSVVAGQRRGRPRHGGQRSSAAQEGSQEPRAPAPRAARVV
jgi:transposase, IS5 family